MLFASGGELASPDPKCRFCILALGASIKADRLKVMCCFYDRHPPQDRPWSRRGFRFSFRARYDRGERAKRPTIYRGELAWRLGGGGWP